MFIIRGFMIFVEVAAAALLIGVIFLQKSKGPGMGSAFGGVGEAIFGTRMGNVLTKATVILAVIFLANTTLLAWIGARRGPESVIDSNPVPAGPIAPGGIPGAPRPGADMDSFPDSTPGAGGVASDIGGEIPGGAGELDVATDIPAPAGEPEPVVEFPSRGGEVVPTPTVVEPVAPPAE